MIIPRIIESSVCERIDKRPVVALLGPRQCGKSTLARDLIKKRIEAVYLDLELPSDRLKLSDPQSYFSLFEDRLICLDEIQRIPEVFTIIRGMVDRNRRSGRFFILGSASRDLLRQSSESLAGRITYLELTPFLLDEIGKENLHLLWLRGGFPDSYLSASDLDSQQWRIDFIRTFLERDIPQLGFRYPTENLDRFWRMCAHNHGQLLNFSQLGNSLGVSHHTVRSYVELLANTYMVRVLRPIEANIKKRLVKTPKIFLRDSGVLHTLLGIDSHNDLMGHPKYGSSWEGFALEQIIPRLSPTINLHFYRSSSGDEIDLILEKGQHRLAIECKAHSAPRMSKGFWRAMSDLDIKKAWIVAPVTESYPIEKNVWVCPVDEVIGKIFESG